MRKKISGYNYYIYDDGRVRNVKSKKFRSLVLHSGKYVVKLSNGLDYKHVYIHRLVAEYFIPNPKKYDIVEHVNEDMLDNSVSNLRWVGKSTKTQNRDLESLRMQIDKYDENEVLIKTYSSIEECAKDLSVSYRTVTRNTDTNNLYRGFYLRRKSKPVEKIIENEIWASVEGTYEISNKGRCWNFQTGKYLKQKFTASGYIAYTYYVNGKAITRGAHVLVAKAFIPNVENLPEVNHKNLNKSDNTVENLEWVTSSRNRLHAIENGAGLPQGRPVEQLNDKGKVIKTFPNMVLAAKAVNAPRSGINRVCLGFRNKCRGYGWRYVEK